ncbi:methionine--tRNA ligase subunit beta [Patescibacteria group bacterium]|nr:methionine--tRNA ligase subunit beta [Patescibacteria group bacterium]MCG2694927.1 methionine--tRNA ligase subunit beta [Candidatus Parcubacteria bacterium]
MEIIKFEDFAKIEIKIGEIKSAEKVEGADRLLVFKVDLGEDLNLPSGRDERQIISGVAEHFLNSEDLIGKQVPVVVNLEPRKIRGLESQGMILYVSDDEGLTTLEPNRKTKAGSVVK